MIDPDIIYAKIGSIQNCLVRIRVTTRLNPERLEDWDIQDIFVLNLQRAVQTTIDLAAHIISAEGLGVPDTLRDSFVLLRQAGIISAQLERRMIAMVGFRNIAVHDYQALDVEVLKSILQHHLSDLEEFYGAVLDHYRLNDVGDDA